MKNITVIYVANQAFALYRARLPLMGYMIDQGCKVLALSPEIAESEKSLDKIELERKLAQAGIEYRYLAFKRNGISIIGDLASLTIMITTLLRMKPRIVHLFNPKVIFLFGWLSRVFRNNTQWVFSITGLGFSGSDSDSFSNKFYTLLYRGSIGSKAAVVFETSEDEALFRRHNVIHHNRTLISIASGVDLSKFSDFDRKPNDGVTRFLCAARLLRSKGVVEFCAMGRRLNQLHRGRVCFTLCGDLEPNHRSGIGEAHLLEMCADSGVVFAGSVDITEMPKLYQSHDVVVLPSYREGYPKVLMEGAACGCALVATDLAGCRGIIVENGNGFLVPIKCVDTLVEACTELLDRERLLEFQAFSRRLALAEFSDSVIASRIGEFYCNLMR